MTRIKLIFADFNLIVIRANPRHLCNQRSIKSLYNGQEVYYLDTNHPIA